MSHSSRIGLMPLWLALLLIFSLSWCFAQPHGRTEINIPDIPGYLTLKCDFHSHTVFSDGDVWPTVRVEEAWLQGLDAIAITDHIEYQIHSDDIKKNHNRPYAIARSRAAELGIILIKGAEITRDMPPGHFNALFLNDIDPLDTKDWRDALKAANDQGAFVFWNHPGWRQPNEIPIWYDEHTELLQRGWFQGIEIVNEYSFYPKAFQWAQEKNLTILGNSDVHSPIHLTYDVSAGQHRPITLVFAKERSEAGIHQALRTQHTAVYHNNLVIGSAQFLAPIFETAVHIIPLRVAIKGTGRATVQIQNRSGLLFELMATNALEEISFPETILLYPEKTVAIQLKGKSKTLTGKKHIALPFLVKNFLSTPDRGLPVSLTIEIEFISDI